MSGLSVGTGLVSGLDIGGIVDALINAGRAPARRLETRLKDVQTTQTGLATLQASLVTLGSAIQTLTQTSTFNSFNIQNSDPTQLSVTARSSAVAGSFQLQAIRKSATHQALSRGFANADQQTVGTGRIVISRGGQVSRPTPLDLLNGGEGVRRGVIRITDRSGSSADIDLTKAVTVDDVVSAINNTTGLSVTASTVGGHLSLTDTSGSTASNLSVSDLNGGYAAADLGLNQSVGTSTLTGTDVLQVTGDFSLNLLDDGNGMRTTDGTDLTITLTDDTQLDIDLDGAVTISDVLNRINQHANNGGKLTASLTDGRLVLTDNSGGGGTSAFTVQNAANSNVLRQLGLETTASGNTITGSRLTAGISSVLLRNLRGGRGIDQIGQLALTDRTGASATVDLTGAESLDEVLNAINTARTAGGVKLQLEARANDQGTGIVITDTSGATASNLTIADVGGGTLAAQLGIAVNGAQTSIDSGSLSLRHVNEATTLDTYAPSGGKVTTGSFAIVDSTGQQSVVSITSAVKTIGDVIQQINSAAAGAVTAQLNDTGDGIVLIDQAGGSDPLTVNEIGGKTAADLRLLGQGTLASDGKYHLEGRQATIITVEATDTLDTLASKINSAGGQVKAAVVNTGTTLNPSRLSLTSTVVGQAGRLIIDDGDLGLGFSTLIRGEDAVLRVGSDPSTAYFVSSASGTFSNAVAGYDVTVLNAGSGTATINSSLDTSSIETALNSFVSSYNSYIGAAAELTKYDPTTQKSGPLQGEGIVLRLQSRFNTLLNRLQGTSDSTVRSLADLGIRQDEGGKLTFDATRLDDALASAPDQVSNLFLDTENGLGKQLDTLVDGFTDPISGAITEEDKSLQATADALTSRIADIDNSLEVRRTRLTRQFNSMETAISTLQSQQQSLTALANMAASMRSSR